MRKHQYFKIIRVDYTDSEYFRLHNETDTLGTFTCTRTGSPTAPNLEYSTDGVNWTTADMSATWTVSVPANGNIYLRGNNGTSGFNKINIQYYNFSMDVDHSAHGNIMSIQNYTTMTTVTAVPNYCFYYLFAGDAKLIDASGINFGNITSIGNCGCEYMFYQCSQLQTSPDMSNVTNIGSSGCDTMFSGCSQLQTSPNMSNVTNIGSSGCSQMLYGCPKLQTVYAPNLATWSTSMFTNWVGDSGSAAATPKIMYVPTQELLDLIPSGNNGYGSYTKTLL